VNREITAGYLSVRAILGLALMWIPVAGQADNHLTDSLRSSLAEQGWQAQPAADGSMIYRQPNELPETAAVNTNEKQRKEQLAQSLNERGWQVTWGSDGSLVLKPKKSKDQSKSDQPAKPAATQAMSELAAQLSGSRYWRTETGKNGELLFHPLVKVTAADAEKVNPSGMSGCAGYQSPGTRKMLPVNHWYKAETLAQLWMAIAGTSGLQVGPINRLNRFYMVGLVEDRAPYRMKYMLAIRKSDGRVIDLN